MELIYDHKDAKLWYDSDNAILKAKWYGQVGVEGFKGLVLMGAEIMEQVNHAHFIFDRRQFENFSPESRIWLKYDFMNKGGDGRRLIRKVKKMAAIKSSSMIGQIAAKVFSKILLFFNPHIEYRTFANEVEAECWIRGLPMYQEFVKQSGPQYNVWKFFNQLLGS